MCPSAATSTSRVAITSKIQSSMSFFQWAQAFSASFLKLEAPKRLDNFCPGGVRGFGYWGKRDSLKSMGSVS